MDNKMNVTPAFMNYLFHVYCCPEPFPKQDAEAFQSIAMWLLERDMMVDEGEFYTLTDKGQIYTNALLMALNEVPVPYWSCAKLEGEK